MLTDKKVDVEIALSGPTLSDADKALGYVFETSGINQRFADYWKPAFDPTEDWGNAAKARENPVGTLDGRPVYRIIRGQIDVPKIISTPDPEYPENARRDRKEGQATLNVVVDERGGIGLISAIQGSSRRLRYRVPGGRLPLAFQTSNAEWQSRRRPYPGRGELPLVLST